MKLYTKKNSLKYCKLRVQEWKQIRFLQYSDKKWNPYKCYSNNYLV